MTRYHVTEETTMTRYHVTEETKIIVESSHGECYPSTMGEFATDVRMTDERQFVLGQALARDGQISFIAGPDDEWYLVTLMSR